MSLWSNALQGGITGAGIGSTFGPYGALAGGGLGALYGLFGSQNDSLMGYPDKMQQLSTLTPEQQSYQNSLLGAAQGQPSQFAGSDYLNSLFSNDFGAYEAPYMRQYREQIVPEIAERFSGMGAGSRSSSGFYNTLGSSAADLSERLAAQRANLRSTGVNQLMQLGQMGLRPSFENVYMQGGPGALQGLLGGVGQGLGYRLGLNNPFSGLFGQNQQAGNSRGLQALGIR